MGCFLRRRDHESAQEGAHDSHNRTFGNLLVGKRER
jgi:hypothetical protein